MIIAFDDYVSLTLPCGCVCATENLEKKKKKKEKRMAMAMFMVFMAFDLWLLACFVFFVARLHGRI